MNPKKPATPARPKRPVKPVTPAKPKRPVKPATPTKPKRPVKPTRPHKPSRPDHNHGHGNTTNNHTTINNTTNNTHNTSSTTVISETNVYNDNRGGDYYGGYGHGHGHNRRPNRRGTYYENNTYYYGNDTGYSGGSYYGNGTHSSSTYTSSGTATTRVEHRHEVSGTSSAVVADPYITLGIGMAGLDANEIGSETAGGADFNLGLGVKGWIASGEFGVHYGAYDPENTDNDISLYGASIDMRLQPRLGFFEPYALVGAGLHGLSDSATEFTSVGASLRLGLGADLRISDYGISARYLHSRYAFDDPNAVTADGGFGATNNQFGVNLLMYF